MPRTNLKLSALQARKQLLVFESELHRAQLGQEWEEWQAATQGMVRKARYAGSIIAKVSATVTQVSTSLSRKLSWLTTLVRGARPRAVHETAT